LSGIGGEIRGFPRSDVASGDAGWTAARTTASEAAARRGRCMRGF
jgi:hypothetical protein